MRWCEGLRLAGRGKSVSSTYSHILLPVVLQAVGQEAGCARLEALGYPVQRRGEQFPVLAVSEDDVPMILTAHDVADCSRILDTRLASHGGVGSLLTLICRRM